MIQSYTADIIISPFKTYVFFCRVLNWWWRVALHIYWTRDTLKKCLVTARFSSAKRAPLEHNRPQVYDLNYIFSCNSRDPRRENFHPSSITICNPLKRRKYTTANFFENFSPLGHLRFERALKFLLLYSFVSLEEKFTKYVFCHLYLGC